MPAHPGRPARRRRPRRHLGPRADHRPRRRGARRRRLPAQAVHATSALRDRLLAYADYRDRLRTDGDAVGQEDVDRALEGARPPAPGAAAQGPAPADPRRRRRRAARRATGSAPPRPPPSLGTSRITARRYLEYLVETAAGHAARRATAARAARRPSTAGAEPVHRGPRRRTRFGAVDGMRVVVLDDWQRVAAGLTDWPSAPGWSVSFEHGRLPDEDAVVARLAGAQAVVVMRERTPLPAAVLVRLPELRLVVTGGMRNAAIDTAAAAPPGHHRLRGPGLVAGDGGARLGAAARAAAVGARRGRGRARRPVAGDRRDGPGRPDARRRRPRTARQPHGAGRAGVRHGRARLEHEPHRRGRRSRRHRPCRQGRAVPTLRRREPAPRPVRAQPRDGRRATSWRCSDRRATS